MFRLDGAAPRSQAEIAARVAAVWLTPQMDRLFQEGTSGRRRFLDRLVWALEPGHAREVAAHDAAMAQRNRLLAEGRADPAWLAGLEDAMARHAVAATAARHGAGRADERRAGDLRGFPAARMAWSAPIAERLACNAGAGGRGLAARQASPRRVPATPPRDRPRWARTAPTWCWPMRRPATPAALASTGEQKALLVGVILRHAALIAEARGFAPMLLLDEPAVHLDPDRRAALFAALVQLPAQTLITGTDAETFLPLAGHRRRPARAWRRIAAGPAFSTAGIGRNPCARDAVAAIYLEYPNSLWSRSSACPKTPRRSLILTPMTPRPFRS